MKRRVIKIANLKLGGDYPVVVKGMIKSPLQDRKKVLKEAQALKEEGTQILRIAIEKDNDLEWVDFLKDALGLPLEADIHFNYKLALLALEKNIDCLRLNPLNIYKKSQVREIVRRAKERSIPIRVGINSGGFRERMSEEKLAWAMVKEISSYLKLLEGEGFKDIMISAKAESCRATILANQILFKRLPYPLDLGLTATGPLFEGLIKSSLTLGVLIYQGIGSAIRVSLNAPSWQEVRVARWILQSLGQGDFYPQIISCPTCSRCKVDLRRKVEEFKEIIYKNRDKLYNKNIKVALMGCVVNGPGEASAADIGLSFGSKKAILFKEGRVVQTVREDNALQRLMSFLIKGR